MRLRMATTVVLVMMGCENAKGQLGATGSQGAKGDMGSMGNPGASGLKGDKGDPGAQGPPGQFLVLETIDGGTFSFDGGVALVAGPAGPAGTKGDKGDLGPQGSQGGGFYVSKAPVYCNSVVVVSAPTFAAGFASCNLAKDLPVSGGCQTGDFGARLAASYPENWNAQASLSRWNCLWGSPSGGANTYTVSICCIAVP